MKKLYTLLAALILSASLGVAACDKTPDSGSHNSGNPGDQTQNDQTQNDHSKDDQTQGGQEGNNPGGQTQGGQEGNNPGDQTQGEATAAQSVYAVGAVTTAKLLAAQSDVAATGATTAFTEDGFDYGLSAGGLGVSKAQNEAEDFNRYFNMLDSFLDSSSITSVVSENPAVDGPAAAYKTRLTVTGKDAAGADVTHVVYYTETLLSDRTSTDRDETVTEKRYSLVGVVEMGSDAEGNPVYYDMSGTRALREETERGETETTETIALRASVAGDNRNYVELSHVSEREEEIGETELENTYTYSVYRNGALAERTQVEFETGEEHGETETEYSVKFLSGASRGSYEIERETQNGRTWISVEYNIDGERGKFVILKNPDGTYDYKFSTNSADDRYFRDFMD